MKVLFKKFLQHFKPHPSIWNDKIPLITRILTSKFILIPINYFEVFKALQ